MNKEISYRCSVVVADDEPMAVRAIEKIIEKNCPEYRLVGNAGNGEQALALIREQKPELVLTDIAMPVMNGLELARRVKEEFPDTCFIVISGYQDYEYMREAIQSGVLDYIAKPIVPSSITATMGRVYETMKNHHFAVRNQVLRKLCLGSRIPDEVLSRYFPSRLFYAALLRENGLPRRFLRQTEPELYGTNEEAYCVFGRDSMEELFLIPSQLLPDKNLEEYMTKVGRRQKGEDSYLTLLYFGKAFRREELFDRVSTLFHALDSISAVGKNQTIDLDNGSVFPNPGMGEVDALLRELQPFIKTKRYDQMEKRIMESFEAWGAMGRPQVWMENAARAILNFTRLEGGEETSLLEGEYLMEEAFFHARSLSELYENLRGILYRLREEEKAMPKADSREFFDLVEAYLKQNLSEQLSLQGVCEKFSISQAYMSKLFRKYVDKSYNQYLTELRIEEAKRLMQEKGGMYIKPEWVTGGLSAPS